MSPLIFPAGEKFEPTHAGCHGIPSHGLRRQSAAATALLPGVERADEEAAGAALECAESGGAHLEVSSFKFSVFSSAARQRHPTEIRVNSPRRGRRRVERKSTILRSEFPGEDFAISHHDLN